MYYGMQDVIAHSGDKGKKGAAPTTKAAAKQVSMYVPASHNHCTVGGMALPSLTFCTVVCCTEREETGSTVKGRGHLK